MKKVLLIDDDKVNAQIIKYYLDQTGGFQTVWAQNAMEALAACSERFDVILLDIMLPDVDGVELCGRLRSILYCPIIFISCIDDEDVVIRALETGGDDYLIKPFSCKVLIARINANLRRVEMENREKTRRSIQCRGFSLDVNEHTLCVRDSIYHLSSIEFGVLIYLINNSYRTVSLDEIYEAVWNAPSYGDVRTVISHVYNLRKKLEQNPQNPRYIRSVRGYGYYFCPDGQDAGGN
ncbi:MAG: response regulator transcription factor [Clostridia bacterium]|nr:response regulator transcription factor [Clostridia bacterium]